MPYRRNRRTYKKRFPKRAPKKIDKTRKLVGQKPETAVEKISHGIGTVATIAKTVAGIVAMLGVEDKYVDTVVSGGSITQAAPYALTLNNIPQGSDRFQRNGNRVGNKCLQVNLRAFLDPTASTLATQCLRVVLLIDKKPQIGPLTWNTVYTPASDVAALINKDSAGDRVAILKDMKFVFSGSNQRYYVKKFYTELTRIETQFTGPAATAWENNAIYLLAISDATGLSPGLNLFGNARVCYTDN